MNVQKKKNKFLSRLQGSNDGDTVKIIHFKRKHFNETMSTNVGFGFSDLKGDSKEFYKWLINNDLNFKTEPISDEDGFGVLITVVKEPQMDSNILF